MQAVSEDKDKWNQASHKLYKWYKSELKHI